MNQMNPIISIAVVDDNPLFAIRILDELSKSEHSFESVVSVYHSAQAYLDSRHRSDILILDIEMPEMNGIELAKQLQGDRPIIIYLTASTQRMQSAFGLNVARYLVKSQLQDLNSAIAEVAKRIGKTSDILVKTDDGIVPIRFDNLVLIEWKERSLHFHERDRTRLVINQNLQTIQKLLDSRFFQINRSQIVNLHAVDGYTTNSCLIDIHSVIQLKISRYRRDAFIQRYISIKLKKSLLSD